MFSLTIADKQVSVFPGRQAEQPVIYLHTFAAEGNAVADLLRRGSSQRCSLVTIGGLDWQHDMVPWDSPALNAQDAPFTGGADSYLHLLGEQIIPAVENLLPQPPSWRGLVGYSLAGLFTLYALYRSDYFFLRRQRVRLSLVSRSQRLYIRSSAAAEAEAAVFLIG